MGTLLLVPDRNRNATFAVIRRAYCRMYAGRGLKASRCVGLPQLALLKVQFLRLAFSEPRAIAAAVLQSRTPDSGLAICGRLAC